MEIHPTSILNRSLHPFQNVFNLVRPPIKIDAPPHMDEFDLFCSIASYRCVLTRDGGVHGELVVHRFHRHRREDSQNRHDFIVFQKPVPCVRIAHHVESRFVCVLPRHVFGDEFDFIQRQAQFLQDGRLQVGLLSFSQFMTRQPQNLLHSRSFARCQNPCPTYFFG